MVMSQAPETVKMKYLACVRQYNKEPSYYVGTIKLLNVHLMKDIKAFALKQSLAKKLFLINKNYLQQEKGGTV